MNLNAMIGENDVLVKVIQNYFFLHTVCVGGGEALMGGVSGDVCM